MNLHPITFESTLSLSRVEIAPAQRARIEKIHADFVAKMERWKTELSEKRIKFGDPGNQIIPVSDEILLEIIRPCEMWCLEIDWRVVLFKMTGNGRFLTISDQQVEAYAVRAGMLLEPCLTESSRSMPSIGMLKDSK